MHVIPIKQRQRTGAVWRVKDMAATLLTRSRITLESCVHGVAPIIGWHHPKELRELRPASVVFAFLVVTAHEGKLARRLARNSRFARKCLAVRNRQVRRMRQAFERFHAA